LELVKDDMKPPVYSLLLLTMLLFATTSCPLFLLPPISVMICLYVGFLSSRPYPIKLESLFHHYKTSKHSPQIRFEKLKSRMDKTDLLLEDIEEELR